MRADAVPATRSSLPYFEVDDLPAALARVQTLGGSVIHPGEIWSICKDSEGSPFALSARTGHVQRLMSEYAAFLRGMNVGGHWISNGELGRCFEELGFRD